MCAICGGGGGSIFRTATIVQIVTFRPFQWGIEDADEDEILILAAPQIVPIVFVENVNITSADGEDMSWDAVKEKLKMIIDNEDKHNPLNDDEIVDKLKEQGIEIARRTVAKYRKILNIPPARQRREF